MESHQETFGLPKKTQKPIEVKTVFKAAVANSSSDGDLSCDEGV